MNTQNINVVNQSSFSYKGLPLQVSNNKKLYELYTNKKGLYEYIPWTPGYICRFVVDIDHATQKDIDTFIKFVTELDPLFNKYIISKRTYTAEEINKKPELKDQISSHIFFKNVFMNHQEFNNFTSYLKNKNLNVDVAIANKKQDNSYQKINVAGQLKQNVPNTAHTIYDKHLNILQITEENVDQIFLGCYNNKSNFNSAWIKQQKIELPESFLINQQKQIKTKKIQNKILDSDVEEVEEQSEQEQENIKAFEDFEVLIDFIEEFITIVDQQEEMQDWLKIVINVTHLLHDCEEEDIYKLVKSICRDKNDKIATIKLIKTQQEKPRQTNQKKLFNTLLTSIVDQTIKQQLRNKYLNNKIQLEKQIEVLKTKVQNNQVKHELKVLQQELAKNTKKKLTRIEMDLELLRITLENVEFVIQKESKEIFYISNTFQYTSLYYDNYTTLVDLLYGQDNEVRSHMCEKCNFDTLKQRLTKQVFKQISIKQMIHQDKQYFNNGSLDFKTQILTPYSKENPYLIKFSYDYTTTIVEESRIKIETYLKQIFCDEQINTVLQYIAAMFLNKQYKSIFQLYSQSGNYGKTIFVGLISTIFGDRFDKGKIDNLCGNRDQNQDSLYKVLNNFTLLFHVSEFDSTNQNILLLKDIANDDQKAISVKAKFLPVSAIVPYFKILVDSNTLLSNSSTDNAFQKRTQYTIELKTQLIKKDTTAYNVVCDYLQLDDLEYDVKYFIKDGNVGGEYCEYVMLEKPNSIEWSQQDADALLQILMPHLIKLVNGDQLKVSVASQLHNSVQNSFREFLLSNYNFYYPEQIEPQDIMKITDIIELYIRKQKVEKYSLKQCIGNLQQNLDLPYKLLLDNIIEKIRYKDCIVGLSLKNNIIEEEYTEKSLKHFFENNEFTEFFQLKTLWQMYVDQQYIEYTSKSLFDKTIQEQKYVIKAKTVKGTTLYKLFK